MDLGLKGKTAVVLGGSKGIGYAIVEAFLKEGARVAFCARKEAELKKAAEEFSALGEVYWEVVDVSQEKQVYDFAAHVAEKFGTIDRIMRADVRELAAVDGIGENLAAAIKKYFEEEL